MDTHTTSIDFTARATVTGPVGRVFDVLTDWPRQTAWVPASVVARPQGGPVAVRGERLVATTWLGPLVLVDPMEVVDRQPPEGDRPGRVALVKTGDVLGGEVEIVVRAVAGGRVRIDWHEHVLVRPRALALLTSCAGPLPGWAGRLAFGVVLRRARRDLEGRS